MSKQKRMQFLKAMILIADSCRNKKIKMSWDINGVMPNTDGVSEEEWLELYMKDAIFADIMYAFLLTMKKAAINGGIECDGIASS